MPIALKVACRIAAAAAACLASGCGSNPQTLTGLTAAQIADKAAGDLKSAPAFTLSGSGLADGQAVSLSLGFAGGNRCAGTVHLGPRGSLAIIMIGGTAWIKPDAAYWKSQGSPGGKSQGTPGGAVLTQTLAGKYLESPASGAAASQVAGLCDLSRLASRLLPPRDVVRGALTTVNGQRVLTLADKADDSTLYVTDSAVPRLVKATSTQRANAGQFTVTYGIPASITPPPASQTVDAARFGL